MPNILSIDGGGIRGIIPCTTLEYIEARTQKPIGDLFDLVVGTSTGGLLALGLTKPDPKSATDAKKIYTERQAEIFHASRKHKVLAFGNLLGAKYPATGVKKVHKDIFGETTLRAAKPAVMVSASDLDARQPVFFTSWTGDNLLMRDCARATCAFPTYFPPARVTNANKPDTHTFVDGGLMALNPSVDGVVAACRAYGAKPEDCVVLSLGTGVARDAIIVKDAMRWGVLKWITPLLNFTYDASMNLSDARLRVLLPKHQYLRVQVDLDSTTLDEMDNVEADNLAKLNQVGQQNVATIKAELDAFCDLLLSRPPIKMLATATATDDQIRRYIEKTGALRHA